MTAANIALASQATFRAAMDALARPGDIKPVRTDTAPEPLAPGAAALVRCLADFETPVWLDPALATPAVIDWIRFQTGAPVTDDTHAAAFAVIGDAAALPDFSVFDHGSEEYPDRSATLIVQVDAFDGAALDLSGPGIRGTRKFAARPLPGDFADRLAANRMLFPRGIDLILVAGDRLAALPRSVRVVKG